jgi:hypothetical protein
MKLLFLHARYVHCTLIALNHLITTIAGGGVVVARLRAAGRSQVTGHSTQSIQDNTTAKEEPHQPPSLTTPYTPP